MQIVAGSTSFIFVTVIPLSSSQSPSKLYSQPDVGTDFVALILAKYPLSFCFELTYQPESGSDPL